MTFDLVSGRDAIRSFGEIAKLDRRVWTNSDDAQFVPDGEHSWRIWAEYSFVCAAIASDGSIAGALCAFDTNQPELHFFHKLFVDEPYRQMGVGVLLMHEYSAYLNRTKKASSMTTSPTNTAMISLSDRFGFKTESLIRGYYSPAEHRLLRTRANPS